MLLKRLSAQLSLTGLTIRCMKYASVDLIPNTGSLHFLDLFKPRVALGFLPSLIHLLGFCNGLISNLRNA